MGFLRHIQQEKFILLNHKKRESHATFPGNFPVGKDIPRWVAPQQSPSPFLFTREMYTELFEMINIVINRKFRKPNFMTTIFMKGHAPNPKP
jgi:hypothetical protein